LTDSGYQGLQKLHAKTQMPKKRSKKNPFTEEDKKNNRQLSSDRVLNENVIGSLKRFKIISDRYRNRRKRFSLRFNLIAGIYNLELNYDFLTTESTEPTEKKSNLHSSNAFLENFYIKIDQKTNFTIR
jgi:DDE superfamily endonuclease